MSESKSRGISRRKFIAGAGAGAAAVGLGLCHLRQRGRGPAPLVGPLPAPKTAVDVVHYGDFSDV